VANFIKTVKRLLRYGDLTIFFKLAAVRHLGFVKINFLTVGAVRDRFCIIVPNFEKIGQTVAGISRFFVIFQDGGRRHLGLFKIRNCNGLSPVRGQFASSCKISSKSVNRLRRYGDLMGFFLNGGRPPSWICRARIGTTREDYLVVFIVVLNLVGIAAVVSII